MLEREPDTVGNMWNMIRQKSLHDKEKQFMWEDSQMTIFDFIKQE